MFTFKDARYWLLFSFETDAHQTSKIIMCWKTVQQKTETKDIENKAVPILSL